jgi:hypothetical protein
VKTIAYLTSEYARAGDTFIRREVEELRRVGFEVFTFSIRRNREKVVSEEVRREQDSTEYILEKGPFTLVISLMLELCLSPGGVWRGWRDCRNMGATRHQGMAVELLLFDRSGIFSPAPESLKCSSSSQSHRRKFRNCRNHRFSIGWDTIQFDSSWAQRVFCCFADLSG